MLLVTDHFLYEPVHPKHETQGAKKDHRPQASSDTDRPCARATFPFAFALAFCAALDRWGDAAQKTLSVRAASPPYPVFFMHVVVT